MAAFSKAQKEPGSLTDEERMIFGTYLFSLCLDYQEQYHLHISSRGDEVSWRTMDKNTLRYLTRTGGKEWWERGGQEWFDDEFVEYVNSQIKRHAASAQKK
jgi:hypothetical protein